MPSSIDSFAARAEYNRYGIRHDSASVNPIGSRLIEMGSISGAVKLPLRLAN